MKESYKSNDVKEYYIDDHMKLKLIITSYKKHPFWIKRKKVRIIVSCLCFILMLTIAFMPYINQPELNILSLGLGAGFIIALIPFLFYFLPLRETCSEGIRDKTRELLTLGKTELVNLYLPYRARRYYNYEEDIFEYSKIQKLEYYTASKKLYIYGRYKNKYYTNFFKNEVGRINGVRYKDSKLVLFMYYENSEDFLNTLSQRCKKEIIMIDDNPKKQKKINH